MFLVYSAQRYIFKLKVESGKLKIISFGAKKHFHRSYMMKLNREFFKCEASLWAERSQQAGWKLSTSCWTIALDARGIFGIVLFNFRNFSKLRVPQAETRGTLIQSFSNSTQRVTWRFLY